MGKSPCDTCRDPGYCCRGLNLNTIFPADMPREKVYVHTAEGSDPWGGGVVAEPTPQFRPIRISSRWAGRGSHKPHGVQWSFSCDWLGEDGRCTDYERRPNLCHRYKAKQDLLCIEYEGSYAGTLLLYKGE